MAKAYSPFLVVSFDSECRRLHTHPATSVTASMAAGPTAAVTVAAIAVLHLVVIAPFLPVLASILAAIVVLSAHCHAGNGKNHQESEHYGSFYFHVSPLGTSVMV
jgi:hypothetical protein